MTTKWEAHITLGLSDCIEVDGKPIEDPNQGDCANLTIPLQEGPWVQFMYEEMRDQDGSTGLGISMDKDGFWRHNGLRWSDLAIEIREVAGPEQLACPNCGSTDLDTMEVATCISRCDGIFDTGPRFEGTTDYERGDQKTVGVWCNNCTYHYEGPDWLTKLVTLHVAERLVQLRKTQGL